MKQKLGALLALYIILSLGWCLNVQAQGSEGKQVFNVPFDYDHDEIILKVKVNGLGPFNMMLDLNTDPSVIDVKTARELNLKLKEYGDRKAGVFTTRLTEVAVGDVVAKSVDAVALDLTKFSEKLGRPLHGVLGHSFTKNRVVRIDYPAKVVLFSDGVPLPEKQGSAAQRVTFELKRESGSIIVEDVYVGGKRIKGTFDTGSDGSFKLTWRGAVDLGLQEVALKGEAGSSVGYKGDAAFTKGTVKAIAIGSITVESPEVIYFMKGAAHDNKPWVLNIGNAFLKDFILTVDYRRKQITLERPL
jgi:hypothetical protein